MNSQSISQSVSQSVSQNNGHSPTPNSRTEWSRNSSRTDSWTQTEIHDLSVFPIAVWVSMLWWAERVAVIAAIRNAQTMQFSKISLLGHFIYDLWVVSNDNIKMIFLRSHGGDVQSIPQTEITGIILWQPYLSCLLQEDVTATISLSVWTIYTELHAVCHIRYAQPAALSWCSQNRRLSCAACIN